MKKSIIVLLSGGADSILLLNYALRSFESVKTLQFDHPCRSKQERETAKVAIESHNLENHTVSLTRAPTYLLMCAHATFLANQLELNTIGIGIIRDDKSSHGQQIYSSSDYYFRLLKKVCSIESKSKIELWCPIKGFSKDEVLRQLVSLGIDC